MGIDGIYQEDNYLPSRYLFALKSQDSDYMNKDSKVAPERSQIRNYVTITSSAVDTRRYI